MDGPTDDSASPSSPPTPPHTPSWDCCDPSPSSPDQGTSGLRLHALLSHSHLVGDVCFLRCSPTTLLLPPESDTKESGPRAKNLEQSGQQALRPSLARKHKMLRRRLGHQGRAREFSMNLFFFQTKEFLITSHPGRVATFPASTASSSTSSLLCYWQSHMVTSHPRPYRPPPPLPWVLGDPARAGPRDPSHLCAGHRMLGRGEGEMAPTPLWAAPPSPSQF